MPPNSIYPHIYHFTLTTSKADKQGICDRCEGCEGNFYY